MSVRHVLTSLRIRNFFFTEADSSKSLLTANSFGLIRLVLAATVVLHHALVLSGFPELTYFGLLKGAFLGSTAVAGFFAISGFLLVSSANRSSSKAFIIHRIFRIFPALWVCLLVTSFLIVPVSVIFARDVFHYAMISGSDSALMYVLKNSALLVVSHTIGTVFSTNPYPLVIDGSLWTLAPEFICYLSLLGIAVISKKRRHLQLRVLVIGLSMGILAWLLSRSAFTEIISLQIQEALGLGISFCVGAILGLAAEKFALRPKIIVSGTLLVIWIFVGPGGPVGFISLSVIVIMLGLSMTHSRFVTIGKGTDISYGVYLYHMPLMQGLVAAVTIVWSPKIALLILAPLTLGTAGIFALFSWRFIEKPSIDFARTYTRR